MKRYSRLGDEAVRAIVASSLFMAIALSLLAQTRPTTANIPFSEADPILTELDEILPAELKGKSSAQRSAIWPNWVVGRDRDIRARLVQGDEDSLVNLIIFGTSYTSQPRLTARQVAQIGKGGSTGAQPDEDARLARILNTRIDDLIKGAAGKTNNERLLFARSILSERKRINLLTASGATQARNYLLASIDRVLKESAAYTKILEQAKLLGDPTEEFSERSRLFSTRGLSSDTSLLPEFALEESLKAMRDRKLINAGQIRRVAIVGPGLDFTDKEEGYDFYPLQTIQPFAILDSLSRLGLAEPGSVQMTTLDLSPRVNGHLSHARQEAARGQGYMLQLPRSVQAGWKPEAVSYWAHFGDHIGMPTSPIPVPSAAGNLAIRAVRVRPDVVLRITPTDLNIVLQRMELPESQRFDLIIGTNIFIYYDVFEQALCLRNVEQMLRPGGLLLTNNALLELPSSRMHSIDYLTVVYSDRPDDGDHIVWYQRAAN